MVREERERASERASGSSFIIKPLPEQLTHSCNNGVSPSVKVEPTRFNHILKVPPPNTVIRDS